MYVFPRFPQTSRTVRARENHTLVATTLKRLRPLVVLFAFLFHTTGCYSWVTASLPFPGASTG
jgi:hypothetical protein